MKVVKLRLKAVVLNSKDNVATAFVDLMAGDTIEVLVDGKKTTVTLAESIPFGHKFSIAAIAAGSHIVKYGEVIGVAIADISPGDYVHIHNVASTRGRGDIQGGKK